VTEATAASIQEGASHDDHHAAPRPPGSRRPRPSCHLAAGTVLGSEGGEIMTIFTHPLLAEGLNTLFTTVDD
jgi:hypothetical protein